MTAYEPGQLLSVDETTRPRVAWLAYADGGRMWAACYAPTLLYHGQVNGRVGWYCHDKDQRQVQVPEKVIARALACEPTSQLPRWPGQVPAGPDGAGWETPVPLTREGSLPAFPVHVLPDWIADFVTGLAVATQTPVDLGAMMALANLSAAAGGLFTVKIANNWREPVNLYLATAMPPGERKTVVVNTVTAPLHDVDRTEALDSRRGITEAKARKAIAEEAAKAAAWAAPKATTDAERSKLSDAALEAARTADSIVVPFEPRLLVDDAHPQALASLMADQGGRMAVLSDEGGIFDLIAGRYSNGRANFDLYLKAWSGSPYRVDRKGRPAEHIDRPALTVGLTVQPDVLRTIATLPGFRGRGLIGRHLFSLPPSRLGWRDNNPPQVSGDETDSFGSTMAALVRTISSRPEPTEMVLNSDALVILRGTSWPTSEPRLGPAGDLQPAGQRLGRETRRAAGPGGGAHPYRRRVPQHRGDHPRSGHGRRRRAGRLLHRSRPGRVRP